MARFTAPADTTGISLTCGDFAVENGAIEVPDDLSEGDRSGLAANGFQAAPVEAPKKGVSKTVDTTE